MGSENSIRANLNISIFITITTSIRISIIVIYTIGQQSENIYLTVPIPNNMIILLEILDPILLHLEFLHIQSTSLNQTHILIHVTYLKLLFVKTRP